MLWVGFVATVVMGSFFNLAWHACVCVCVCVCVREREREKSVLKKNGSIY